MDRLINGINIPPTWTIASALVLLILIWTTAWGKKRVRQSRVESTTIYMLLIHKKNYPTNPPPQRQTHNNPPTPPKNPTSQPTTP